MTAHREEPSGAQAFDKHGRPFAIGDVVKIFHYIAAIRRERCYMYKQVTGLREWDSGFKALFFSHLDMKLDSGFHVALDGRHYQDYEIVQSACDHFKERPKHVQSLERHHCVCGHKWLAPIGSDSCPSCNDWHE